ncbi:acyl-CoA thioesterase [Thalassolituus sp. LLYu03]|uniref:acyl-CoA thioesterase n=1 Tax=Thalassolituus sp. LLYu03 TaxID=3421656 RepID=UPI003D2D75EF
MWSLTLQPRFGETDALGHINNTVLPVWFEDARTPLFRLFTPDLNPQDWHLIIAKIEVEFVGELFYGREVEVRTYLSKLGNSSMTIAHEAWQDGRLGARGTAVMVHFDHSAKKSVAIPDAIRAQLSEHLQTL